MNLEDRLYSSTEVAEILGVSLRSIYRYLEEGDLKAEIRTITGRHRFSRQNILDFLYPGSSSSDKLDETNLQNVKRKDTVEDGEDTPAWIAKLKEAKQVKVSDETGDSALGTTANVLVNEESQEVKAKEEGLGNEPGEKPKQIDWLSRFKAAKEELEKSKEQAVNLEPVKVEPAATSPVPPPAFSPPASVPEIPPPLPQVQVPKQDDKPVQQPSEVQSLIPKEQTQGAETKAEQPQVPQSELGFFYYTSGVGGLKELAHSLNKSANTSLVPYAFTMYAGMSLFKTIKPFSILHAYVKPEHKAFFEKALQLRLSDKNSAQICLITSDDKNLFDTIREMHGLRVVSLVKLRKDLLEAGEDELVGELDAVQG